MTKSTTPVGFEPTRALHIGLAGQRLNHSAKVSSYNFLRVFRLQVVYQYSLRALISTGGIVKSYPEEFRSKPDLLEPVKVCQFWKNLSNLSN